MAVTSSSSGAGLPDLFIVGAPRTGTTALFAYLKEHPDVSVSRRKEPNYFLTDLYRPQLAYCDQEYLELFDDRGKAVVCEASPLYLCSNEAIPNIMRFNPRAKVIAVVRNPVNWLCSWHAWRLYSLDEDESDIEAAWHKQEARKMGHYIPPRNTEPRLLQYRELGSFGEQVERAMQWVPSDQLKIIVHDDLATSPQRVYEDVLRFLEIPQTGRTDFPLVNLTKRHRSLALARLLDKWLRSATWPGRYLGMGRFQRRQTNRLIGRLAEWNSTTSKRRLPPAFHNELVESFRSDVEKLGRLIGRDLSHWLAPHREARGVPRTRQIPVRARIEKDITRLMRDRRIRLDTMPFSVSAWVGEDAVDEAVERPAPHWGRVRCQMPWVSLLVSPKGASFCRYSLAYFRNIRMREGETLMDVWNSPRMREARRLMLAGKAGRVCLPSCPHVSEGGRKVLGSSPRRMS